MGPGLRKVILTIAWIMIVVGVAGALLLRIKQGDGSP